MIIVGFRGGKRVYLKTNKVEVLEMFVKRFDRWEYISKIGEGV